MEYFINHSCSASKYRFPFQLVLFKAAGSTLASISKSHWPVKPSRVGFGRGQFGASGRELQAGSLAAVPSRGAQMAGRQGYLFPCSPDFLLDCVQSTAWGPRQQGERRFGMGDAGCNTGQGCVGAWEAVRAVKEPEPSPVPKSRGSPTALRVDFWCPLWEAAVTPPPTPT